MTLCVGFSLRRKISEPHHELSSEERLDGGHEGVLLGRLDDHDEAVIAQDALQSHQILHRILLAAALPFSTLYCPALADDANQHMINQLNSFFSILIM